MKIRLASSCKRKEIQMERIIIPRRIIAKRKKNFPNNKFLNRNYLPKFSNKKVFMHPNTKTIDEHYFFNFIYLF